MDFTLDTGHVLYGGALGLVLIGLVGMLTARHALRVLLALTILEAGINLFLVAVGYRPDAAAPLAQGGLFPAAMVDPIPQALILTAIVIGVGVLALGLALAVRAHAAYGTLDLKALAERIDAEGAEVPAPTQLPVPAQESAR